MAQEKIIIQFQAKGNEALERAIKSLDNAVADLRNETRKYGKEGGKWVKNNRLLDNSFATLRSKMLLFNFAMGMGIRQLILFSKEATKVQSMERAFNTLAGGVANSSIALNKLQEATNGTMSQFDLFQQANNAMILGVSKNSEEMAEMFDMAQRLGNALGTYPGFTMDENTAVEFPDNTVTIISSGGNKSSSPRSSSGGSGDESISFSSTDPNNMTTPVVKSLYNMIG